MNIESVIAIITAVSALVLGLVQSRKTKAEGNAVDISSFRTLVQDVTKLKSENVKIQENITALDTKNRALWQYVYMLIDFIKDNKLTPPSPPVELESDPKLAKLLGIRKQ